MNPASNHHAAAPTYYPYNRPRSRYASCNVAVVGGVLGALVALLLAYGVVATVVIVVLMLRSQGKVSIDQPVYAG